MGAVDVQSLITEELLVFYVDSKFSVPEGFHGA